MRVIEDLLTDPQAQAAALGRRSVVPDWPADPDRRLHDIVEDLDALEGVRVFDAEFGDYGCGYASFVEVKVTRRVLAEVLQRYGYVVVDPAVLSGLIAPGLEPDTNLGEPPWRVFDAWFYWFD